MASSQRHSEFVSKALCKRPQSMCRGASNNYNSNESECEISVNYDPAEAANGTPRTLPKSYAEVNICDSSDLVCSSSARTRRSGLRSLSESSLERRGLESRVVAQKSSWSSVKIATEECYQPRNVGRDCALLPTHGAGRYGTRASAVV
jgi:hypothetical protein